MHLLQLREQLKHEDLVHLLYGIARNWAYSVTTRVDIDRGSITVNEERNGKTPANARASEEVPAGIHVRRAVVGYGGRDGGCCR